MKRFSRWSNYINRYQIGLLGLLSIIIGVIFYVPPAHFVIVMTLIGFVCILIYLAIFIFIQKQRTSIIAAAFVGGLLLLQVLRVLDVVNFMLLSAVSISLVLLFREAQ